jgi:hypothetical protein
MKRGRGQYAHPPVLFGSEGAIASFVVPEIVGGPVEQDVLLQISDGHYVVQTTRTVYMAPEPQAPVSSPSASPSPSPAPPEPPEAVEELYYADQTEPEMWPVVVLELAVAHGDAERHTGSPVMGYTPVWYTTRMGRDTFRIEYGDDIEPPAPSASPSPTPSAPISPRGTQVSRPVQLRESWDTGVMLLNNENRQALVMVSLFKANDADPSQDATLVYQSAIPLGAFSSIKQMVRQNWGVPDADALFVESESDITVIVGWVSPPIQEDGDVRFDYALMGN